MSDCSHPELRVGPDEDPDRYVLGPVVDSGSEGILYRGSRAADGIELEVAIKMLQPGLVSQVHEWYRRWNDQVQLLLSLQVRGVVGVRDGFLGPLPHPPGESGGGRTLYLVMNWVEGEPLHEWVRRRPDRDPLETLKLLLGVASALDVIHSGQLTRGVPVVHCDVKPSNIVITAQGSVLVDFGLIRALPDGPRLSQVTGTPGYLAPEVVEEGIYTVAADRYALGAVAYFVITGNEPPKSHQPRVLRASLAAVPALAGQPDAIDRLMAMLDEDPDARPSALANWVGQLRRSSLPDQFAALAPEAPRRNPSAGASNGAPPPRPVRQARSKGRRVERGTDVVRRAGELGTELSTLAQSLYEVESDNRLECIYGWTDADGCTGRRSREIVDRLSPIWAQYLVAKDVVDELDAAVAEGRIPDAERLLGPDAIDLADGTTTSAIAHVRDLRRRLLGIWEGAQRLMASVELTVSALATATTEVEDLVNRATALG
ncbi:MAG: serine/threonine protein kinase, partial [Actinomycetota bacterium]|nr:serine/threonine protein kinase [Actinomycetota bacterium]